MHNFQLKQHLDRLKMLQVRREHEKCLKKLFWLEIMHIIGLSLWNRHQYFKQVVVVLRKLFRCKALYGPI